MSKKLTYQLIYLLVGIIFILMSFTASESFDLVIKDTYYVIENGDIYIVIGLAFIVFAGTIWMFKRINRSLNKTVLWIHLLTTTITLISSLGLVFLMIERSMPKRYTDYSVYNEFKATSTEIDFNLWLMLAVVTCLLAQVLFVGNMIFALVPRKKV